jgi:hypothetical protein
MTDIREDRKTLFSKLQSPETQPQFWARVADDVDWTVEGPHPLAGRYHNKQQFIDATFGRLAGECPRICVGMTELEGHAHHEGDADQDRCGGGSRRG